MIKTRKIRILSLVLILFQLLVLVSCASPGGSADDTSDDRQTTDTAGAEAISLVPDGEALYSLVRPEKAGEALVDAVSALRNKVSEGSGVEFKIMTDWVKSDEEIDNRSYEILIGATNRAASAEAGAGLLADDYIITLIGNKIVILGGSEESTLNALKYFTENCLLPTGGASVILSGAIEYRGEYPGEDLLIAGARASEYCIVYSGKVEDEEGIIIAKQLNRFFTEMCGITLEIKRDIQHPDAGREIIIGKTNRNLSESALDTFEYSISTAGEKLFVMGGSSFALYWGIRILKDNYMASGTNIDDGMSESGSMYGRYLYEREEGANVRIMSNNVWDRDGNSPAWAAIGEDCSARVRSVGLAAVYMAYLPDVICFQEMSIVMITRIKTELSKCGYDYSLLSFTAGSTADNTCILYRTDTVELKGKGRHSFTYGNNGGSKSYTWGVFTLKQTGEQFAALSTHMWWKSEANQTGSDKWRADQAAEIVVATKAIADKFNCPVFAVGDFNTRTNTAAFAVFIDGGFSNTYNLAEVYADNNRGYHTCNADGFARETTALPYEGNAIDHILIRNAGATRILTFDHVRPYFYIKLSDHYPVFVDAVLGQG